MRHKNIALFIPHLGCPHQCVFCDQRTVTGYRQEISEENIIKTIEENLVTMPADINVEIAFFGGSFTGLPIEQQNRFLDIAQFYVDKGKVNGIRMSTRPDYINDKILNNLKNYSVSTIELGVQSMSDKVLKMSHRGHSPRQVHVAAELIKKYDFNLGLQMMLGLPGDTENKAIRTAEKFVKMNPDCVRIYPTLVFPDTGLYQMYEQGKYIPLTVEQAVNICKRILQLFYQNGINVIRVGLLQSEINAKDIIGPYHPSFRELVESAILLEKVEKMITQNKLQGSSIVITIPPKSVSKIIGNKKYNIYYLKGKYSLENIVIKENYTDNEIRLEKL